MAQESKGKDITDEALNRPLTKDEKEGRRPLIPDGIYEDCTVNILGAREFENDDGGTTRKVKIRFDCPATDADLTTQLTIAFTKKSPFYKLINAVGVQEGESLNKINGKRVTMVVGNDEFRGNPYNTFAFMAPKATGAAASAKK